MIQSNVSIVIDDKAYVVVEKRYPVNNKRKSTIMEAWLNNDLKHPGDTVLISSHAVAVKCGDGTMNIYEF